jgi:hypothetical protein
MLRVARVTHKLTREQRVIQGLAAVGAALKMAVERGVRLYAGFAFVEQVFQTGLVFRATQPRISS